MTIELPILCVNCANFGGYNYTQRSTRGGDVVCISSIVCNHYDNYWYGLSIYPRIICPHYVEKNV